MKMTYYYYYYSLLSVYFLFCVCLVQHASGNSSMNGLALQLLTPNGQQKDVAVGVEVERHNILFEYTYSVTIGIGTLTTSQSKPYKEYPLHVDTSSPLSWLQCEGCNKNCFNQSQKPFPKSTSKSYHPILPSDKQLCLTTNKTADGHCSYTIRYDRKSFTEGILAKEDFFLCNKKKKNKTAACTNLGSLAFGCGMKQKNMLYSLIGRNKIAGVLGLGWGPLSFVRQIEPISDGKFSHCFPPSNDSPQRRALEKRKTRLRFGADAVSPKQDQASSTRLHMIGSSPFYYVELVGISFNGRRLNKIKESVFRIKKTNTKKNGTIVGGGVIINSGKEFTQLASPAFDVLVTEFNSHFLKKLKYEKKFKLDGRRCYKKPRNVKNYDVPVVTFHFKGTAAAADLVLKADALMEHLYYGDTICLGINCNYKDNTTVIGAHQMVNHWFTFDTKNNLLSFHPEDCNVNG